MNPNIQRTAWRDHMRNNTQFYKPTPRTFRDAFGWSDKRDDDYDAIVFVVVLICAVIGFIITGA